MNKYESMYILKPDLEEEAKDALVAKFSDIVKANGGEVEKIDEWGKRKLAYPINYINEGYYVLMTCECKPSLPAELDRVFKITEGVMRSLITAVEE